MVYWLIKSVLAPLLDFLYRIEVEGLDHVPRRGPAILASNHVSFSDSIFLAHVLRRQITFLAKSEYFDSPKTAWICRALGQIPVKRGERAAARGTLASAKTVLDGGGLLGIYPEGSRSRDGRLRRGKTGVAHLALDCRTPVLAVGMVGTAEIQPVGRTLPRVFMPVTIRISPPIDVEPYLSNGGGYTAKRQLTDDIMGEVGQAVDHLTSSTGS